MPPVLRVILGVTGGIAAYKSTEIVRLLTEAGHLVKVIPTQNALRFIGATTLEALSHNTVDSDLYSDVADVKHVKLGQEADLIIVAPATASFLARFASGTADDLLGNTLLASAAPVLVAPAMHTEMWEHAATKANVETLRSRGVTVLEPDSGRLTGSDTGAGRLPEPAAIVEAALQLADKDNLEALATLRGMRVVVTAGGTHEPIDAVRFIGNRSSGKQGIALARVAAAAGALVTLIAANVSPKPSGVGAVVEVETAAELQRAVLERLGEADVLIMAAAVADYRLETPSSEKLKRSQLGEELTLKLVANPDILRSATAQVRSSGLSCYTVGFAAETAGSPERLAELASSKLAAKGCDLLVANDVSDGRIFGDDETKISILGPAGDLATVTGSKLAAARAILATIAGQLSQ